MNSLNHIPLLRLLIPFTVGIIGVIYVKPNLTYLLYGFGITIFTFLLVLSVKRLNASYKLRWILGVLIYLNMIMAGACLTGLNVKDANDISKLLTDPNNDIFVGTITEPIQIKERSIKAVLSIRGIKNKNTWVKGKGKALIYLEKDKLSNQLSTGDCLSFKSELEDIEPAKNPHEFDYKKYLAHHKIYQQTFLKSNDWKLVRSAKTTGLVKFANMNRKRLIKVLEKNGILGKELAVASALILGYKDNIDTQLRNTYSRAGAMHILAVSGLHVGIIFVIFHRLLSVFNSIKYGRITKGILLIIILWSYAILTGLSPSVMRATTMFSFIVVAKTVNRRFSFFNTLAASAFVLLIYDPLLIVEVGFQLSYLAVSGIVIIQPWIINQVNFRWWLPGRIWEITAVSIAAQIATFPMSLLYFHQFPNYFLLSNIVVIPLAIFILYTGLIALIFSFIPIISDFLAGVLNYLIRALNYGVEFIDKLPFSVSENIRFNISDAYLAYFIIIFIILFIAYRKFRYLMLGSTVMIIFLVLLLCRNYEDLNQRKLIIYNTPKHSTINFIDGTANILVSDFCLPENRDKLLFHVQNNWINHGVKNEIDIHLDDIGASLSSLANGNGNNNLLHKGNYFQFYEHTIALVNGGFSHIINNHKLAIDLLIITKNNKLSIQDILNRYSPKEIVIDASNSFYTSKKLKAEANLLQQKCWAVLLDGVYAKNMNQ